MKDKVFVDTNLLVYSIGTELAKKAKVESLFQKPFDFVISTQVISEFSNTCFRKKLLPNLHIREAVEDCLHFFNLATIDEATLLLAFDLKNKYGFSWYDALIVAAAIENDCSLLFSEDMQHGLVVERSLTIENPFL